MALAPLASLAPLGREVVDRVNAFLKDCDNVQREQPSEPFIVLILDPNTDLPATIQWFLGLADVDVSSREFDEQFRQRVLGPRPDMALRHVLNSQNEQLIQGLAEWQSDAPLSNELEELLKSFMTEGTDFRVADWARSVVLWIKVFDKLRELNVAMCQSDGINADRMLAQ